MGLWDALAGRSKATKNNLDSLFAVPSAAITLQTAAGFTPTGIGSVCFRSAAGAAFAQTRDDVVALIKDDPQAPDVEVTDDGFGYTWVVVHRPPDETGVPDVGELCTDLHAVNTSLETAGFAGGLLCSVVPFADTTGRKIGLVYLYKQGTFYAFAPVDSQASGGASEKTRDNLLEISVRDQLKGELPMEPDLSRWFALWGAPGL